MMILLICKIAQPTNHECMLRLRLLLIAAELCQMNDVRLMDAGIHLSNPAVINEMIWYD